MTRPGPGSRSGASRGIVTANFSLPRLGQNCKSVLFRTATDGVGRVGAIRDWPENCSAGTAATSELPAYQYPDGFYCCGFASADLREVCRQLLVFGSFPSSQLEIKHPDTDKVLRSVSLGDALNDKGHRL